MREQNEQESFSGTAFPAALSDWGQPATKTTVEWKASLIIFLSRMLPFSRDPYFGRVGSNLHKFNSVKLVTFASGQHWLWENISSGCVGLCVLRSGHNEKVSYGKIWNLSIQMKPFQKDPRSDAQPFIGNGRNHHSLHCQIWTAEEYSCGKGEGILPWRKNLRLQLLILGEKVSGFKAGNNMVFCQREIPGQDADDRKKDQGLSLEIAPSIQCDNHMYFDNARYIWFQAGAWSNWRNLCLSGAALQAEALLMNRMYCVCAADCFLPEKFFLWSGDFPEETGLECYRAAYGNLSGCASRRDWITCKAFLFTGRINFQFLTEMAITTRIFGRAWCVCAAVKIFTAGYDDG